jgi:tetraacyldisaccharide 4'-kinase
VGARSFAYAIGLKKSAQAPLPVISIGNLSAGGTGKTPATAYVAKGLFERGFKPAVLTRGYGADQNDGQSDEARELARSVPSMPIIVNPNRTHGAQLAKQRDCNVAVLDDGFQHWQLKRDLDIVLIDATRAFESAHRLPWGYLRESRSALRRTGIVLLTRADQVSGPELEARTKAVRQYVNKSCLVLQAEHKPAHLRKLGENAEVSPDTLKGRAVWAACGLGNPGAFFKTVAMSGASIKGTQVFADHHAFTVADCAKVCAAAKSGDAELVLITEKDAAKWESFATQLAQEKIEIWVLSVEFQLTSPNQASEFWGRIEQAIRDQ